MCRYLVLALFLLRIAEAQVASVSVHGTVLDPSGASVPGAQVTVSDEADVVRSFVTTDVSGEFRLHAVPQRTYSLDVQHDGFGTVTIPLYVGTSSPERLIIRLPLLPLAAAVSVSATEEMDVSPDPAAALDSSLIDRIPVFDQDYLGSISAFLDAAMIGTTGPQLLVDGVRAPTSGVSPSAVQEVQVNQNTYFAEYARPGKATVELFTKIPTPEYHGTVNFVFRNSVFNARDAFALVRAPEERRIIEGVLSGALGHSKRTRFMLSGSRQEEDLQSIVFARGLSGAIHDHVSSPQRTTFFSERFTQQLNEGHNLSVQYVATFATKRYQGVGGTVLPEAGRDFSLSRNEVVLDDRVILSPRWVSQFQVALGQERQTSTSVRPWTKIVIPETFTGGGAQLATHDAERQFRLSHRLSWASHKHSVRLGIELPIWNLHNVNDRNNFGGSFYFSTLDDYAAGRPYAFRQQTGNGHVIFGQRELGGFLQDDFKLRPNLSIAIGIRYEWQNFLHDNNNVAPRIGFAYGVSPTTVIRAGAGVFYDRTGAAPLTDLLLHDGTHLQSYLVTDPAYPDAYANLTHPPATDLVRFDDRVREPYTVQHSIGIEQRLTGRTSVSVNYTGAVGISLFRSRDANAPLGPTYMTRPNAAWGFVRQFEAAGRQRSTALDMALRGQITSWLTGVVQYTFSRTHNNTGGLFWVPANQYDLADEWALADFHQTHRLALLESLDLQHWFTLGVALTAASGKPYSLTTGEDTYHTGFANARPPGVPRNSLQGPGFVDLDLRWSRDFRRKRSNHHEGAVATLMFDAFNVLNHVNDVGYVGNRNSPLFGRAVAAHPTRRLQFTLRIRF